MKNNDIKTALYKNGFSAKQMIVIERAMQKSGMTMADVLRDLSLRFLKVLCILVIFLTIACYEIFYRGYTDFIPFVAILLIFILIIRFFVPFRLSFKSFVFMMKRK